MSRGVPPRHVADHEPPTSQATESARATATHPLNERATVLPTCRIGQTVGHLVEPEKRQLMVLVGVSSYSHQHVSVWLTPV